MTQHVDGAAPQAETPWADEVNRRIAEGIVRRRGTRSAQWLSDETDRLGHRVSRETIANFERGRKKALGLPDLMVIAAALNVGLVDLTYPDTTEGRVRRLPHKVEPAWSAALWMQHAPTYDSVFELFFVLDAYVRALEMYERSDDNDPPNVRRGMAESVILRGEQALALYSKLEPKVWPHREGGRAANPEGVERDVLVLKAQYAGGAPALEGLRGDATDD